MNTIERIRLWLRSERELVTATTMTATENISALAEVTGMILLPMIPALLTGLSIYFTLKTQSTWDLRAVSTVAMIVGIGLESLGIAASKTAMRLYRAYRDKLSLKSELIAVIITTTVYVTLVTAIIALGEGLPPELRWLGYASPLLAVSMYVVVGFNADIQERRDLELAAKTFEHDVERELRMADVEDRKRRMDMKREMELRQFEQKQELKMLKATKFIGDERGILELSPAQRRVEARKLLDRNPNMTGAQLGRHLAVSERAGQMLKKEIQDDGQAQGKATS